ncbi:adenosylcobinamide-GDP ribazoletransferase [Ramlibacter sp. WS9]|uniref:adenosylcobinamide-GDP ribazoletransferase n=1 Tax=Ramlibacter sp. WS9 TaxID=1882741 RepID=UPI001E2CE760|nr:adenosylcobinamide-GDP ribazoletransferase [Ramlibacter sp. WS9]
MNKLAPSVRAMVLALQYFTRVPMPRRVLDWTGFDETLQRASLAHFPGAGWVVGIVGAGFYAAMLLLLPPSSFAHMAAAVVSTIATVLLTGALHEDGLADTADGLAAGSAQQALEVMKDSRLGPSGALAVILALLAKIFLLSSVGIGAGWVAAIAALMGGHVVSRGLSLGIVATLVHVGHAATSKSLPVARQIGRRGLLAAAIWCVAAWMCTAVLVSTAAAAVALILSLIALWGVRLLLARRLAGFTGDCLGATQQLCEIAFYLGMAVAM